MLKKPPKQTKRGNQVDGNLMKRLSKTKARLAKILTVWEPTNERELYAKIDALTAIGELGRIIEEIRAFPRSGSAATGTRRRQKSKRTGLSNRRKIQPPPPQTLEANGTEGPKMGTGKTLPTNRQKYF